MLCAPNGYVIQYGCRARPASFGLVGNHQRTTHKLRRLSWGVSSVLEDPRVDQSRRQDMETEAPDELQGAEGLLSAKDFVPSVCRLT